MTLLATAASSPIPPPGIAVQQECFPGALFFSLASIAAAFSLLFRQHTQRYCVPPSRAMTPTPTFDSTHNLQSTRLDEPFRSMTKAEVPIQLELPVWPNEESPVRSSPEIGSQDVRPVQLDAGIRREYVSVLLPLLSRQRVVGRALTYERTEEGKRDVMRMGTMGGRTDDMIITWRGYRRWWIWLSNRTVGMVTQTQ
ncbi:hypothetical protein B0H13DRAFT_2663102 [Mycena leptocephala]|nr:hypothetical protein B0H13DRAFT_2663102 [Mycena leptocephala]